VNEDGYFGTYLDKFEKFDPSQNIAVGSYLQSFRYFEGLELPFRLLQKEWAESWIRERDIVLGIHIRRGDFLTDERYYHMMPPLAFYEVAMQRVFGSRASEWPPRHRIFVASDDPEWVRGQALFLGMTLSTFDSAADVMSLLSSCPQLIVGVSTFSWWSLYFHGGGIYYAKEFSKFQPHDAVKLADYYPPSWTGLTDLDIQQASAPAALVIPLQNREVQLQDFHKHLCDVYYGQAPFRKQPVLMVAVEQMNQEKSFSRSWLFNVGLRYVLDHYDVQCIAIHDVDLLPFPEYEYYAECSVPTHLSSEAEHKSWTVPYAIYVGGVFMGSREHWKQVNGMSNLFQGWGVEDDELYVRLKLAGLVDPSTHHPFRPKHGKFWKNSKEHFVKAQISQEYENNIKEMADLQNGVKTLMDDGLTTLTFKNISATKISFSETCDQNVAGVRLQVW